MNKEGEREKGIGIGVTGMGGRMRGVPWVRATNRISPRVPSTA